MHSKTDGKSSFIRIQNLISNFCQGTDPYFVPDHRLGEKTAAIVEIKDGMTCTKEELDAFCQMLPRYKRPKEIIFNTIPRNATGKIEKPKLRKMYGADQLVAQENRS